MTDHITATGVASLMGPVPRDHDEIVETLIELTDNWLGGLDTSEYHEICNRLAERFQTEANASRPPRTVTNPNHPDY